MSIEKQKSPLEKPPVTENPPKMPTDHPEKKDLFGNISDTLRTLSESFWGLFGLNEEGKPNKLQEFFSKILGIFGGIDIEKGVTIEKIEDVQKVREAFRPIIDLNDTAIELKPGDFIQYNKDLGTVDFYPADSHEKSGHSLTPNGIVPIEKRRIPVPKPEDTNKELQLSGDLEKGATITSKQLAHYITRRWPAKTGADSCGTAVDVLLNDFGIKNVTPGSGRHGKNWQGFLEKDPRFKRVEINSLADIPEGGIMTYNGRGMLNGKLNGSAMNQKFGHVEIKWSNGMFYSFYASNNPGGSAKEPQLHNNFEKWKQATGFTGVYVPVALTKEWATKHEVAT